MTAADPAAVMLGKIRAEPAGRGLYQPGEGALHHTLPVIEGGELVDIVAWRPEEPSRWRLRTGGGWLLGHDNLSRYEGWGEPVPLYASPLDWHHAGGDGIAIVDWRSPRLACLRDLTSIAAATRALGERLERALRATIRFPDILVPEEVRLAA